MSEFTITLSPPDPELEELVKELYLLRAERQLIEERIGRLLKRFPEGFDTRPQWGPCTRCGHTWKGMWANLPPRGCPRCGSTGWRIPPRTPNARFPDDAPNPRWGKNRKTGLPTDPANRFRGRPNFRPKPKVTAPDATAPVVSLTPPPRLDDVMGRPTLVPPPQVRFAEREAPQPESLSRPPVLEEPDDGVPVRINEDGSLTELISAVEGDGSILPEGDSDEHDTQ